MIIRLRNFTSQKIDIISVEQLEGLELEGSVWLADSMKGEPLLTLPREGMIRSSKGSIIGVPTNLKEEDILIVREETLINISASGNPLVKQMCSPYKVVRMRDYPSVIFGCIGLHPTFS